jgi:hypothetical protein
VIHEDQVFVVDVVVMDLTWEMVVTIIISWPADVATKLSAIDKIYKYRKIHEEHHFIPMAMEMHNAPRRDMDCFIKESIRLFHGR